MIEYLRLAFGTFVVLLPGALVARALGHRGASATLAWGFAAIFVAWTAVFALHRSIHLAVFVLLLVALGALAVIWRRGSYGVSRGSVWLFGIVLGWILWHVEGVVSGDGLFHEARVRKLVDLTSLHLRTVDEFKDGGLHPGYAFPLWHGFLALVSWVSGVDAGHVVRHEPSLLVPLACVVAWEAGRAVFGSRWGGFAVLLAQLAMFCFGPGHGGSYATLTVPGTAARQLFVPAAIALFFERRHLALAAVVGALALTHPTYALFLLIPLFALVFWEWRGLVAAAVPTALVLLWLRPIVAETRSHDPGPVEKARALHQYGDQLVVVSNDHYRLAAEVFGRSGAVAVASLLLLPFAALAIRRRWAAFVLGGSLLVLLLMLVPFLFVHFADAVSLSQARRAAGFAPLPFAFAGGLALVVRRVWAIPIAFLAGLVLQLVWPGDFEYGLRHGGPAFATWFALVGGLAALAVALVRRVEVRERHTYAALAAFAFTFPVIVHGAANWSPRVTSDPLALSPRLVHSLRTKVPRGAIVLAPVEVSYRVAAAAPVYVVAAPVAHVANTNANDPYRRARDVRHWALTNDPRVAERYGATWAIRAGRLYRLPR